jgi:hypothetical protein
MAVRLFEIVVIGVLVLGSMPAATAQRFESSERAVAAISTGTGDEENRDPAVP